MWFILGLFIGAFIGVLTISLTCMKKLSDETIHRDEW